MKRTTGKLTVTEKVGACWGLWDKHGKPKFG